VSAAVPLAFGAAAAAVLGAWELLVVAERTRIAAALGRVVEPVARAGSEGREPSRPERVRLAVLSAATLTAGGWLLGGPGVAVLAGVSGPALAVAVIRGRRRRYARELRSGAPDAARALADALGAGHSVRGAIAAVAPAVPGPAGHELRRAARSLALGDPTEAALERLRARAGSRAWDTLVAGILLQRDAGGDLAALLRDLAASLEAAARAERDALAATAQARFTARLVLGLPLGAALLAELADPGLLASRLAEPLPAALIATAAALQAVAVLAIRHLTRDRP
jgi:tight adherence protein B